MRSIRCRRYWGHRLRHEPLVRFGNTTTQLDAVAPSERPYPGHVEKLSGRAIRLIGIEDESSRRMDDLGDQLCQLTNREIFTSSHIDVLGFVVMVHQKHAGVGE